MNSTPVKVAVSEQIQLPEEPFKVRCYMGGGSYTVLRILGGFVCFLRINAIFKETYTDRNSVACQSVRVDFVFIFHLS